MRPSGRERLITSAGWVTANDWYQQVSVQCPDWAGGGQLSIVSPGDSVTVIIVTHCPAY